ncbi:uncharacterized protein [Fopius arisanus]|uniref:Death domain-containing protein n=1 Tax=Fopius arisanus TaxID=64838 RepID=A0A9R1U8M0_9HYME|nr:PREDICTED: uncharacterized protein LOC105271347 [Fopius arisanus]
MAYKKTNDPDMEILRQELPGPPSLELSVVEIEKSGGKIHAAYLFEEEGIPVLQKMCLLISSTPTGKTYSATWQHFGAHLGLSREQMQCIEYDFKGLQDPTYYVLLTFVQSVDATMDKILEALMKMERWDIIHRLFECLKLFMNNLCRNIQDDDFSRPECIPKVPLVLSPTIPLSILNINRLSSKIHTAYLFGSSGIPMLQKICRSVGYTPAGKTYNGWQELGLHLGLTKAQLHYIKNDLKGLQDPAYYVLWIFVQSTDATMDKILNAFIKMNRLDIIDRLCEPLMLFIKQLNINSQSTGILRPKFVLDVPSVLTSISNSTDMNSGRINPIADEGKINNYGIIVMLTFTADGQEDAQNISRKFREKKPRIGVVTLQEQAKLVYCKAEEFIDDCFKQVNYVIPILTKGYVQRIIDANSFCYRSEENSLDSKYLNYVYSLLRFEYVQNNCYNYRVRCLVPDVQVPTVIKSDLHPTLQAWFRMSDINDFADNILLKNI